MGCVVERAHRPRDRNHWRGNVQYLDQRQDVSKSVEGSELVAQATPFHVRSCRATAQYFGNSGELPSDK